MTALTTKVQSSTLTRKKAAVAHCHVCFVPDVEQSRTLVSWLENQKIREYPEEERGGICGGPEAAVEVWQGHLAKYIDDLALGHDLEGGAATEANLPKVLQRLLNFAVGLEFRDDAAAYNRGSRDEGSAAENVDPEVLKAITGIGAALQLPEGTTATETLQAARALVAASLTPEAMAKKGKVQRFNPQTFSLGFTTGDKSVDRAATVLRLLYIDDLRSLQTQVNEIVSTLQDFTANPKTDSKLGKVGR